MNENNDYNYDNKPKFEETSKQSESSNLRTYTSDPAEHVVPHPHRTKRGWFFKFAAYVLILTFVSGATFGAGYLTAISLNRQAPARNETSSIIHTSGNGSTQIQSEDSVNITQLQPIVTTVEGTSTIATIAREVSPSIVTIASYSDVNPGGFFGDSNFFGGTGSGIAFAADEEQLYIVTNYHVIESATEIEVIFSNGETVLATPLGFHSRMDVAVLSVDIKDAEAKADSIVLATFGDSDTVEIGELAIAIGNPLGLEYASTVTSGIISALGREVSFDAYSTQVNLIQTDAAINPGNSGGALLNAKGEVIGINSAKYVDESVEGIGFAIPINDAIAVIDSIISNPNGTDIGYELSDDRAFLGVNISDITTEIYNDTGVRFGVYVTGVFPFSGAEEAGIMEGDIIYTVNDTKIRNIQSLFNVLENADVNDIIEVGILRGDDILTLNATLYSYKDVMEKQE